MKEGIYKIRTVEGRIITLTVNTETHTHIGGVDKFGKEVLIPRREIDRILPETEHE